MSDGKVAAILQAIRKAKEADIHSSPRIKCSMSGIDCVTGLIITVDWVKSITEGQMTDV